MLSEAQESNGPLVKKLIQFKSIKKKSLNGLLTTTN